MTTAYSASNPVAMGALPTTNGIVQSFSANITNPADATYAPDGLPAAPIFGLGGAALQGNEIVANGVVTLVSYVGPLLNSGSLCWILFSCAAGAQQVGTATASQHATTAGQVVTGSLNTATAGGTANAITASFAAAPTTYSSGQPFTIISSTTNTAAMTAVINLGGVAQSSVPIVKGNNLSVVAGDFPAGYPGKFAYSSAFGALVLQNPATGVAASAAQQLMPLTASVASNLITASLASTTLEFRSATLVTGGGTAVVTSALSIAIPSAVASLGAVSGIPLQIIVLVAYNAGVPVLCLANVAGGLDLSESGLISPTTISASATANNVIYSASAVAANSPYRVVGYLSATWTSGTGWTLTQVQSAGGLAMSTFNGLGYGQTLQNVTSARANGVTYYNTTHRPIFVMISAVVSPQTQSVVVNGTIVGNQTVSTSTNGTLSAIVPVGGSYSYVYATTSLIIELR